MDGYKTIACYSGLEDVTGCALEFGAGIQHGSTLWLKQFWQTERNVPFTTVDVEPMVYKRLKSVVDIKLYDGVKYLQEFGSKHKPCKFAYVDAYDYHGEDPPGRFNDYYRTLGFKDAKSGTCVMWHLALITHLEPLMAEKAVVIFDDTNFRQHRVLGKGAFAVPYLIGHGWGVDASYSAGEDVDTISAFTLVSRGGLKYFDPDIMKEGENGKEKEG